MLGKFYGKWYKVMGMQFSWLLFPNINKLCGERYFSWHLLKSAKKLQHFSPNAGNLQHFLKMLENFYEKSKQVMGK